MRLSRYSHHRIHHQEKHRQMAPAPYTGVPNKHYRGPRQVSSSDRGPPRRQSARTSRNSPPSDATVTYRGPQQMLPGSSTSTTGASDKNYRGPQQALPGSPTSTTGAPDKNYRGPQQIIFTKIAAKPDFLSSFFGGPLLLFLL